MKIKLSDKYSYKAHEGDKETFFGVSFVYKKGWFAEVDNILAAEMEAAGRSIKVKAVKRVQS